ncbi:MAG: 50S ribosomal protein L32e [Euryarchaeota archaeon]|nr:50S ribosomal protein L32e [Euryarchaeota archaeon]
MRRALHLRREIAQRRPSFLRQEWFRYKRLGLKWRKPQGQHTKLRRHLGYRPNVPSIGYRGPKAVRGLHPSGFREVLVHTAHDLEHVDPKVEAVRIAAAVGMRRRLEIQAAADERGIRVLNRREQE